MAQSTHPDLLNQLKSCLSLARDLPNHEAATATFETLKEAIAAQQPQLEEALQLLWDELLAARRSATFWQEICDVEKELSERIAANHVQLRQNYLRLMQEQ